MLNQNVNLRRVRTFKLVLKPLCICTCFKNGKLCNFRLLGVSALSQQTAGYEPFEREVVLAGTTQGPSRGYPDPVLGALTPFLWGIIANSWHTWWILTFEIPQRRAWRGHLWLPPKWPLPSNVAGWGIGVEGLGFGYQKSIPSRFVNFCPLPELALRRVPRSLQHVI